MASKGLSVHLGLNMVSPAHYQGWDGKLLSAVSDAEVYQQIARKSGFEDTLLTNEECSSEALNNYLKDASERLVAGDILFLSYSGHGGSILDVNGDEMEGKSADAPLDEFDETWCLYDRQYLDDELFAWFSKLAAGVRVLIFSDSCHSGSIAKAALLDRELENPDGNEFTYLRSRLAPMEYLIRTYNANKDQYNQIEKAAAMNSGEIGAYVLQFGACQDFEQAYEAWGGGLFTKKVKRVLESPLNSYTALFEKIQTDFGHKLQHPNLYQYGNKEYHFLNEVPFSIGSSAAGKPIFAPVVADYKTAGTLILELPADDSGSVRSRAMEMPSIPTDGVSPDLPLSRFKTTDVPPGATTEWDEAYKAVLEGRSRFAEPNIASPYYRPDGTKTRGGKDDYLKNWPQPEPNETEFYWHLDDKHSQLRKACEKVVSEVDAPFIRIGHIDTGYVEGHPGLPANLRRDWGVSFVKDEFPENKGIDRLNTGSIAEQDGHGTATMIILAGGKVAADGNYPGQETVAGAVPFAEIVPIRICETVFNSFSANDVAEGIDYAVNFGCEVITMSMAGYPTRRVAEAVNRAYENGVIVVTASGNNFTSGIGKLSPRAVLYPARFSRVIAATGVCCNGEPYDLDANSWYRSRMAGGETMQGNWGPRSAMKKALAAFTPNVPWATIENNKFSFSRTGGGTSSATPQVAAAAALWIAYNRERIKKVGIEKSWKKVEAARKALFSAADKSYPAYRKYYGNGVLNAIEALNAFDFSTVDQLRPSEKAHIGLAGLGAFFSGWVRSRAKDLVAPSPDMSGLEKVQEMVSLELLQLMHRDPDLMVYAEELDLEKDETAEYFSDPSSRKVFGEKVLRSPLASEFLKDCISQTLAG